MPRTTPFFRSSAPSVATDSETVKLQALLDADPTTMPFVKLSQLLPANEQVRAMTYQALCIRKSEKAQQADWAGEVAAMTAPKAEHVDMVTAWLVDAGVNFTRAVR